MTSSKMIALAVALALTAAAPAAHGQYYGSGHYGGITSSSPAMQPFLAAPGGPQPYATSQPDYNVFSPPPLPTPAPFMPAPSYSSSYGSYGDRESTIPEPPPAYYGR